MANRLYNKQVSPKGYQEGGKVKRVARDKGTPKSGEKGFKHKGTLQEIKKKIFGKKKKRYDRSDAKTDALHPAVAKELRKKGLTSKKVREDILKEKMKSFKVGGRVKKMGGGSLKGYQEGGKVKKKKSIIQSIIDIPKTIKSNNDAIRKIGKKMDKEKRLKDKMSKAKSKAFSESLKQPRKLERLDDKIKENAKKVAMMRATGQI